jgi:TonB family protein
MNASLVLENIGVFSLQAAALILVGLLLPRVLKLARPLVFLQMLLVAVVLLPLWQSWTRPVTVVPRVAPGRVVLPSTALQRVDAAAPVAVDWALVGLGFLGLGVAGRAAWLALGLARLRSLRQYAEPVGAGVAVSTEIAGPVTFGFRRPVILLPPAVMALSEVARAAILAHERAHIRRRDWLFALSEEIVLCVLWFHPAVWLLVSRIRLVREQVVDLEASRAAASREIYVDALLAVAEARMQPYFAPAPPFLRRRQLAARIHSLILEVPMSRLRTITSYGAAALCTIAMAVWVTTSFPLQAAPQLTEAPPDNISVQGAEFVFGVPPAYPISARRSGVEGPVTVEVTLAPNGEVSDARVISGPQELRRAAMDAVLNFQFKPGPTVAQVTLLFRVPAVEADPNRTTATAIEVSKNVPPAIAETLRARLAIFEGQPFAPQLIGDIMTIVQRVSRNITVRMEQRTGPGGQKTFLILGPPEMNGAPMPGLIRVGGMVQAANLIEKVDPVYPPLARQARIHGTVRYNVTIDREGAVSVMEVVSGHPLLITSAQVALRQYRYKVTKLNGQPVEVSTQVDVNFTL